MWIGIIFYWTILGIIIYMFTIFRKWTKTRPHEIEKKDILKSIPFGFIAIFAVTMAYLIEEKRRNNESKKN